MAALKCSLDVLDQTVCNHSFLCPDASLDSLVELGDDGLWKVSIIRTDDGERRVALSATGPKCDTAVENLFCMTARAANEQTKIHGYGYIQDENAFDVESLPYDETVHGTGDTQRSSSSTRAGPQSGRRSSAANFTAPVYNRPPAVPPMARQPVPRPGPGAPSCHVLLEIHWEHHDTATVGRYLRLDTRVLENTALEFTRCNPEVFNAEQPRIDEILVAKVKSANIFGQNIYLPARISNLWPLLIKAGGGVVGCPKFLITIREPPPPSPQPPMALPDLANGSGSLPAADKDVAGASG